MAPTVEVSVLMPIYNGDAFLEPCLKSLRDQTFSEFEIVAVDDGSTDGTAELLEDWRRSEPRLRVLRRQHQGLVTALNAGLAACRGRFIARMDADDVALRERLELQARALAARPSIDVLGCLVEHFGPNGVGTGFKLYERWLNGLVDDALIRRDRFVESPLAHPSVMMRRGPLLAVGGYRDRNWPEDYDLWLRLAARGCRFAKLPRVLQRWRDHPQRLTRTDRRYAVERFLECKAHHLAAGPLRGGGPVVVWGAGQTGRRLSKHLLRLGVSLEAFVDIDREKCGRTVRGRAVISPRELEDRWPRDARRPTVLAAVSSRGARAKIRRRLRRHGWRETHDFWCVA